MLENLYDALTSHWFDINVVIFEKNLTRRSFDVTYFKVNTKPSVSITLEGNKFWNRVVLTHDSLQAYRDLNNYRNLWVSKGTTDNEKVIVTAELKNPIPDEYKYWEPTEEEKLLRIKIADAGIIDPVVILQCRNGDTKCIF